MMLAPIRPVAHPWLASLLAVWLAGSALVLGRFGLDVLRTRALLRDAIDAPVGTPSRLAIAIARRLRIRRPVRVLFSDRLSVPVTWGILRPVVILPLEAWEWQPRRIRIVLLHELAHVQRLDCLWSAVAALAAAMWWFHPLQWICRRRLRVEQERACDDAVLLSGVGATAYASVLVEFARRLLPGEESSARAAIAMARRSTLRDRVEAILASGSRSVRLDRRTTGMLAVVAAALLLPVAAVHLWGETAEARRTAELIAELRSADPEVREAAAWGLGALGAEEAVEPLIVGLADPAPRIRGVAARSLGKIGGERAFAPLAGLLDDPDPFVRELAILGIRETSAPGIVDALVPLLDDHEMGVRSVAVWALSGLEEEAAVRALAHVAETDADEHTRQMAITGLVESVDRGTAVSALVRLLEDDSPETRDKVAWALTKIGDPRGVPGLVARLGREESPEVRGQIMDALAAFAGESRAVDGLVAGLRDPDSEVRVSAAFALADSDDPRAAAALLAALHDPVHQVRLQSAWSLNAIEERR
jgi:HEAT repeat protein